MMFKNSQKEMSLSAKTPTQKGGFTLLFSVLVSTLVLAVGASLISIALRQLILSGTGRDSQYAFYAANTGIECAMYWDLKSGSSFPILDGPAVFDGPFVCLELPLAQMINDRESHYDIQSIDDGYETKFRLQFPAVGPDDQAIPYCADVTVFKEREPGAGGLMRTKTTILSRGYNTCDPNNPRRIERGLKLEY